MPRLQECVDALKAQYPDVDYRILEIELGSQKAVRAAAAEFLSWIDIPELDILINSAGVGCLPERIINEDGIEMHLAINHVGHWLFTNLVLPKLIKSSEKSPKGATRIVNVTSGSPTVSSMRWSDMNFEKKNKDLPAEEQPNYDFFHKVWRYGDVENKTYVPVDGYNRSKVANVLFGIGANKRWFDKYGIVTLAVHPGVIKTELVRSMAPETLEVVKEVYMGGMVTVKNLGAGSSTTLVGALDPKLGNGVGETANGSENYGAFLVDCQVSEKAHPLAVSSGEAEKLWKLSEELVKQEFA
ncbi:SDR family NAD(P)-dependent oxidoreductase [Candidatus Bathyarchaeota archaeon]|nr:SDR family NAD(P)-dependent oxidoreductase [Candidatus Bathyarchaeota archaeon]